MGQGKIGDKGPLGPKGESGIKGDNGDKGDKGDKGDSVKGDKGNTGPPGGSGPLGSIAPLSDNPIYFRGVGDVNHGISYSNNKGIDGPSIWGNNGGGLGTVKNRDSITWDPSGNFKTNSGYFSTRDSGIIIGANQNNSFIFHVPNDDRNTMFIAPGTNGTQWDWSNQIRITKNGELCTKKGCY